MTLRKTPEFIRRTVPERHMQRSMRWVLIFVIGFYLGDIHAAYVSSHSAEECGR